MKEFYSNRLKLLKKKSGFIAEFEELGREFLFEEHERVLQKLVDAPNDSYLMEYESFINSYHK